MLRYKHFKHQSFGKDLEGRRGVFSVLGYTHMRVRKTTPVFRARIYGNGCSNIYALVLVWLLVCRPVCVCRWATKTTFLSYEPELYNNTLFKYYPSIPIMFETLALISLIETILGTPGNRSADGLMLTPFLCITKSDFIFLSENIIHVFVSF